MDERQRKLREELENLLGQQRQGLEEARRRQREFREKLASARKPPRRTRKPRRKGGSEA